jgi:hypothetical protein
MRVDLRGQVGPSSENYVHSGLETLSKTWLGEKLMSESLSALVFSIDEGVPCVL